jgi:hypothetical protein
MKTKVLLTGIMILLISALFSTSSCKQCKKEQQPVSTTDTTAAPNLNVNTIDAPHGDTSLIPVLGGILEHAFALAQTKDYAALGAQMVYRGPVEQRHGVDVFDVKNSYDKNIVKVTAEVFNKWTTGAESLEYARVFQLPQPDGRTLEVLEVIIVYPKKIDRKFFGFLLINNEYKIADVTSYL